MPSKVTSPHDRTWVEIDREALRHNLRTVRSLAGQAGIMAIVKANAYGHGLEEVARVLNGKIEVFAVASLGEAVSLRKVCRRTPILLLSAALPSEYGEIGKRGFIPTLSSRKETLQYARSAPKGSAVHLKVDTGMGRLGALPGDALTIVKTILRSGLSVHSISTHLSAADSDDAVTRRQLKIFEKVLPSLQDLVPDAKVHALNSAGTMLYSGQEGELVRVGLALYGVSPLPGFQPLLRPALSWKARVTFIHDLPKGHRVSYGGTYTTPRRTKAAILPAGYADGYPRQLSGHGARVLIRGKECPVLGRITMDQIVVDVSHLTGVKPGDEAVLVGCQRGLEITATEVAEKAGTIPWHLFCGITGRVAYRYRG